MVGSVRGTRSGWRSVASRGELRLYIYRTPLASSVVGLRRTARPASSSIYTDLSTAPPAGAISLAETVMATRTDARERCFLLMLDLYGRFELSDLREALAFYDGLTREQRRVFDRDLVRRFYRRSGEIGVEGDVGYEDEDGEYEDADEDGRGDGKEFTFDDLERANELMNLALGVDGETATREAPRPRPRERKLGTRPPPPVPPPKPPRSARSRCQQ